MSLRINSVAPDFTAETTQGTLSFHDWIGDSWAILFSHPKDFTPVCTTELGYMAGLKGEFDQRHTKIIGLSVDPVANHSRWAKDIEETQETDESAEIPGLTASPGTSTDRSSRNEC
jgi:alkyl hydroperoxide reductase subunit AhpC